MAMKVTMLEHRESVGVTACEPRVSKPGRGQPCHILVDHAVAEGWTTARASAVLELYGRRCRRWQHPRDTRRLGDSAAGGTAVHAKTAPAAAGNPRSVGALGRHQRWLTQRLAPRLLPQPCLRIAPDAASRTGSSETLLCPPGPCAAGDGAAATQSLDGRQAGPVGIVGPRRSI